MRSSTCHQRNSLKAAKWGPIIKFPTHHHISNFSPEAGLVSRALSRPGSVHALVRRCTNCPVHSQNPANIKTDRVRHVVLPQGTFWSYDYLVCRKLERRRMACGVFSRQHLELPWVLVKHSAKSLFLHIHTDMCKNNILIALHIKNIDTLNHIYNFSFWSINISPGQTELKFSTKVTPNLHKISNSQRAAGVKWGQNSERKGIFKLS